MFNNDDYLQYVCLIVDLVSKVKERKQTCSHVFCQVVICPLARESINRKMALRRCKLNKRGRNTNELNVTWTRYSRQVSEANNTLFSGADQIDTAKYLLFVNQIRCSTEGMKTLS